MAVVVYVIMTCVFMTSFFMSSGITLKIVSTMVVMT